MVIVPNQKEWESGSSITAQPTWNTNGSKTETLVRACMQRHRSLTQTSVNLNKDTTVFQPVNQCVGETNRYNRTY